jgi:chemotaxis protein MotB
LDNETPIIIVKKKAHHGGHHGGAWKVAYADFVTAMMALFIVLWLMNTDTKVQDAVGAYFRDPAGVGKHNGSGQAGTGSSMLVTQQDMVELKEKIEAAIKQAPELQDIRDKVVMTVTGEGLRIELLEDEIGTFFDSGNARPTAKAELFLTGLTSQVTKLPNRILIEGHTDARPFSGNGTYSNWELSADRANSARRIMAQAGLPPARVSQVRGFADQLLRKPDNPNDASNRRISLIIQYGDLSPARAADTAPDAAATPTNAGHSAPDHGTPASTTAAQPPDANPPAKPVPAPANAGSH